MMKKVQNILFVCLFFASNLFLFFYLNYSVIETRQMLIANRLYTTWHTDLIDGVDKDLLDYIHYLPNNSRIFLEHDYHGTIRTMYQKGDWHPPLLSGVGFNADIDSLQAMVGVGLIDDMINEGLIKINGIVYEVVGMLGTTYPSPVDDLIILNQNKAGLPIERVVVDTNRPISMNQISEIFGSELSSERQYFFSGIVNSDIFSQLIFLNVLMIMMIVTILSTYLYSISKHKLDIVKNILGYKRRLVFLQNSSSLVLIFICSLIPVVLMDFLLGNGALDLYYTIYPIKLTAIFLIYSAIFSFQLNRKEIDSDV